MIFIILWVFFPVARPAKIPPKNQEAREANFAKYFPPNPQHFAKFRSRSAFAFSVFPHFCFCRSSVLCTEALQRAGNASILYHRDCFQNKFEFCTMNTAQIMKKNLIIYWARRDLRLRDNRALLNALKASNAEGIPLLPVFFIEPYMTCGDPSVQFGYPSRYFLARALPLFTEQFETFGLFHAKPVDFFKKLAKKVEFTIYVNEDVYPDFYTQIKKIRDLGISIKLFRDQMTVSKETATGVGDRYSVFTPFKKSVWLSFVGEKEDKTASLERVTYARMSDYSLTSIEKNTEKILNLFSQNEAIRVRNDILELTDFNLPERSLSDWYFSEAEALLRFKKFLKNMSLYHTKRDALGDDGTSKMSLGLAWGLVSARTLVSMTKKEFDSSFDNPLSSNESLQGPLQFISELIWREFYKYLFFHNPKLFREAFQDKFKHVTWMPKKIALERFQLWIQGKTGYPIVDAAMMQLARTGWMHNRTRMVVSSILTKNLGVDWRWGQEYFRAMLVDLDEASNNGGWQWGASVGADPKPIRIFNPYLQAKNYDPENIYQNKWLSEEYIKNPPDPIVPHEQARGDALSRYGLGEVQ
jgi:deoxyribodipyrimidine photo-lyase